MILVKFAADGSEMWNKTWGGLGSDWGNTLIQTSDDGFALVGGGVSFGAGGWEAHVVKYLSDGSASWAKTWGSTVNDGGNSVMQSTDGGIIIGGWTHGYGAGDRDAFLAKYNSLSGELNWSRVWGGTGSDTFVRIRPTVDGFIANGNTTSYGAGSNDALFVRYAADGTARNCDPSICRGVSGSVTIPAATVGTVTVTVADPVATVGDPNATVNNNPAFTDTDIFVR